MFLIKISSKLLRSGLASRLALKYDTNFQIQNIAIIKNKFFLLVPSIFLDYIKFYDIVVGRIQRVIYWSSNIAKFRQFIN